MKKKKGNAIKPKQ